jgi:hypothetical protein
VCFGTEEEPEPEKEPQPSPEEIAAAKAKAAKEAADAAEAARLAEQQLSRKVSCEEHLSCPGMRKGHGAHEQRGRLLTCHGLDGRVDGRNHNSLLQQVRPAAQQPG